MPLSAIDTLMVTGLSLFVALVVQVLLGKRVIGLEGRRHWDVHRWLGYAILAYAAVHGALAIRLFAP